jgi:hypothetical protein
LNGVFSQVDARRRFVSAEFHRCGFVNADPIPADVFNLSPEKILQRATQLYATSACEGSISHFRHTGMGISHVVLSQVNVATLSSIKEPQF